nr:hypothetical protein [Morchella crassipes]
MGGAFLHSTTITHSLHEHEKKLTTLVKPRAPLQHTTRVVCPSLFAVRRPPYLSTGFPTHTPSPPLPRSPLPLSHIFCNNNNINKNKQKNIKREGGSMMERGGEEWKTKYWSCMQAESWMVERKGLWVGPWV